MMMEPDGTLGAAIASESLGLTDTMINGAGGCRSRTQIMLHELIPSYSPENVCCRRSKCFSEQSRLPCTYINNDDIVFGTSPKIQSSVDSVSEITSKRALLLDTLGASLICTDYSGLTGSGRKDPITIKGDLSAMSFSEGYDVAMCTILSTVDMDTGRDGKSVNILGYSIMDLGWEYGVQDIRHLLGLMGVKLNCVPGCLPEPESVRGCGKAALNIMIHPEYCIRTAKMLESRFGTPYLRLKEGAPIGYPAVRAFVIDVAREMDVDPKPALDYIDEEARAVHKVLMNFDRIASSLYAKGFVIRSDSSAVYPLMRWMIEAFGMAPRMVKAFDEEYMPEITGYLESVGHSDALAGAAGEVEVVFTDGLSALEGRNSRTPAGYVEVRLPRGRQLDLVGRTMVGTRGCRYVLDEMMNGIRRFRCGQPTAIQYRPGGSEEE